MSVLGELSALSPATVSAGTKPYGTDVSPDGKNVYVGNLTSETVSQYSRNEVTGALTALSPATVASEGKACRPVVSPDGRHVYVTTTATHIMQYSRNTATGELSPLSPKTVSAGESPENIAISSDGKNVYVVNNGSSSISQYSRNIETGLLSALSPATISTGSFSNGICISKDGNNVYVGNASGETISQYSRNTENGLLAALSPATVAAGLSPEGVAISPDGTSVYLANRDSNSISQYSRNVETGKLTALSPATVSAGTKAHAVAVSPDGENVYVANEGAATISQFSRASGSGKLTALSSATIAAGTEPYGVVVSPDGKSVYANNEGSANVSQFSRFLIYTAPFVSVPPSYKTPRSLFKPFPFVVEIKKEPALLSSTIESKFSIAAPLIVKSPVQLKSTLESKFNLLAPLKVGIKLSSTIKSEFSITAPLTLKVPQKLSSTIESKFSVSAKLRVGIKLKSTLLSEFSISAPLFVKVENGPNTLIYEGQKLVFPSLSSFGTPSVEWRWWLCRSSDLGQIAEITTSAHQKNLKLFLNQAGTCTFWMHLLDPKCQEVQEHTTCIVCYRNGKAIWSGPVYDCIEKVGATEEQLQVTAMGWFQEANKRIIHTGLEWQEMAIMSSGKSIIRYPTEREKEIAEIESLYAEVLSSKFYVPLATESALELSYFAEKAQFSTIAADLIIRANIDYPMKFTVGSVPAMNSLNFKVPQFHPLGELLNQLATIESGYDWEIDPLTRKYNIYYNAIRGGVAGKGKDRGAGVRFIYPGNCIMAERHATGTKTQNRTEVVGQYGVGKSEDVQSIQERGLYEASENLSDVTNIDILIAYAQAQDEYLKKPFTIISFSPKSINAQDNITASVPRPFEDYELGDIVYTTIERGNRFRVGTENPQPVRIYGMNIEIDDNGVERVSGLQTTYSS